MDTFYEFAFLVSTNALCIIFEGRPNLPLLQFSCEEYVSQLGLAVDGKHTIVLLRHNVVEVDAGDLGIQMDRLMISRLEIVCITYI